MRRNLRPRTTIPDSEDDSQFSETSLKNSSPLRRSSRSTPLRAGGSSLSRSRRVIQDSEADEEDYIGLSDSVAPDNPASGGVAVVVPMKNESPSDSNSQSPLGNLSTGYSTPATSVGAAATEPDTKIAIKTSARINAADRVKKLQSSALSLGTSQRGRKRSAAALVEEEDASDVPLAHAFKKRTVKRRTGALSVQPDPEASDTALAHALQMEEYKYPRATTEQRLLVDKFIDEHLEYDSDPDSRPVFFSPLSSEPPGLDSSAYSDTSEDPLEDRSPGPLGEGLNDDLHDSGADLPPTWEEQRKARRVSRVLSPRGLYMLTIT